MGREVKVANNDDDVSGMYLIRCFWGFYLRFLNNCLVHMNFMENSLWINKNLSLFLMGLQWELWILRFLFFWYFLSRIPVQISRFFVPNSLSPSSVLDFHFKMTNCLKSSSYKSHKTPRKPPAYTCQFETWLY